MRNIGRYRAELMGLATIQIVLFHFAEDIVAANSTSNVVYYIALLLYLGIGSIGVDIFAFLSGYGIYHSLDKKFDKKSFYIKRVLRIVPSYLLIGGSFWFVKDILILGQSFLQFLKDVFMISFWTQGKRTTWYITYILIMYLIYPVLHSVLRKMQYRKYELFIFLAILASLYLLKYTCGNFYDNSEIALWRVIPFILGAWYAKCNVYKIDTKNVTICISSVGVFLKLFFNLSRNNSTLLAFLDSRIEDVFLVDAALVCLLSILKKVKYDTILKWLRTIGQYSLQLYLTHVCLRNLFKTIGVYSCSVGGYLAIILLSALLSVLVYRISEDITEYCKEQRIIA